MKPRFAWAIGGTLSFLFILGALGPWQPGTFGTDLQPSWQWVLHHAFANRLQFGHDLIFTFGPYGFIFTRSYHPATFWVLWSAWLFFSCVFLWTSWTIGRRLSDRPWVVFVWLIALISTVAAVTDSFFQCLSALLIAHYFWCDDRRRSPTTLVLVVAVAWAGLIKFTYLLLGTAAVTVISVDEIFRRHKAPRAAPVFAVAVLAFWLMAGQRLAGFGSFIRGSWEVASGYAEAMSMDGPGIEIILFLIATAVLVFLMAKIEWRTRRVWATLPVAGLGVVLFMGFKHGFVRHPSHSTDASAVIFIVALLYVAAAWPTLAGRREKTLGVVVILGALAVGWLGSVARGGSILPGRSILGTIAGLPQSIAGAARFTRGTVPLKQAYDATVTEVCATKPMPALSGSVDLYSYNQGIVLAHGFTYNPRPVFQSYSAYTPALLDLNAQHLRDITAPGRILFKVNAIDQRYPSQEESLSWPELLTRYDITEVASGFLVLEQLTRPRLSRLSPLSKITPGLDAAIPVPSIDQGAIWTRIDIKPTLLGRIASMLFKPPIVYLTANTREGLEEKFRIVPSMARVGFLLSPLVDNGYSFAVLSSDDWQRELAILSVTNMTISVAGGNWGRACYRPEVTVEFSRLDFPRQDLSRLDALRGFTRRLCGLRQLVHGAEQAEVPHEIIFGPVGQTILYAQTPSRFSMSVPAGSGQVRVGFGFLEKAWRDGGNSDGVEFRVSAASSDGRLTPVWSRYLDPVRQASDRGGQHVDVPLTVPGITRLVFETLPGGNSDWDWAYWSEATVE